MCTWQVSVPGGVGEGTDLSFGASHSVESRDLKSVKLGKQRTQLRVLVGGGLAWLSGDGDRGVWTRAGSEPMGHSGCFLLPHISTHSSCWLRFVQGRPQGWP